VPDGVTFSVVKTAREEYVYKKGRGGGGFGLIRILSV
jgi:hypothetical protein